jgi:hypothetical protein
MPRQHRRNADAAPTTFGSEMQGRAEWLRERFNKIVEMYELLLETASPLDDAAESLDSEYLRTFMKNLNGFGDRWLWQGKENISDSVTEWIELIESETSDFLEQETEGEVSYADAVLKHGTRNQLCKWFDDTRIWIEKVREPLETFRGDVEEIYHAQSELESAAGELKSTVIEKVIAQANELEDFAQESYFDDTLTEMVDSINSWVEEEQERLAEEEGDDEGDEEEDEEEA